MEINNKNTWMDLYMNTFNQWCQDTTLDKARTWHGNNRNIVLDKKNLKYPSIIAYDPILICMCSIINISSIKQWRNKHIVSKGDNPNRTKGLLYISVLTISKSHDQVASEMTWPSPSKASGNPIFRRWGDEAVRLGLGLGLCDVVWGWVMEVRPKS